MSVWLPYSESLRFIWSSFQEKYAPLRESKGTVNEKDFSWKVRVYEPILSKPLGLIAVVNGFSVKGDEDERIHNICRAAASAGFRVVQPSIQELNELRINSDSVEEFALCLKAIAEDPKLGIDGRVALFAPSFTAGLGLNACAHPKAQKLVSSICAVGTFARINSSVEFLLKEEEIDDYGRLILMKNFIELVIGPNPEIINALQVDIEDNGFKRKNLEFPDTFEKLSPENKSLYLKMKNDADFRFEIYNEISKHEVCQDIYSKMDVMEKAGELKAPITLIHGAADDVIPPSESEELHNEIIKSGGISELLLTPLLSHGDIQVNFGIINNSIKLAQAFQFFFKHARSL